MPRVKGKAFETFGDGVLTVCRVEKRRIVETRIDGVRFGNRTVGVTRFFKAKLASDEIGRMVAIPFIPEINGRDVILIGAEQYDIVQIQNKYDTKPPCRYLSLKQAVVTYEDTRNGKQQD